MKPISTHAPGLQPFTTFGEGSLQVLGELLDGLSAERLFLVVDKPAYVHSGAEAAIEEILSRCHVTLFSEFELNPKLEDVLRGMELFTDAEPDVVIAIGGGSAIDMAKLINACVAQDGNSLDYVLGKIPLNYSGLPLIAVPTTSGTGSEATHFAVVYVDGSKYSLAHPYLLPGYVIVDPELTYSLPRHTTAASGLDALCQSIESLWAVGATDESVDYSSEALLLAIKHLEAAVCNPTNVARSAMAKAAHLSGKAINITKTTAPHALSYAITTHFGMPHGCAVALSVGAFLKFNSEADDTNCTDPRGVGEVRRRMKLLLKLLDSSSAEEAQCRIRELTERIDCPVRLSEVGITRNDFPMLISQVNVERMSNNPRKVSIAVLYELLETIL